MSYLTLFSVLVNVVKQGLSFLISQMDRSRYSVKNHFSNLATQHSTLCSYSLITGFSLLKLLREGSVFVQYIRRPRGFFDTYESNTNKIINNTKN